MELKLKKPIKFFSVRPRSKDEFLLLAGNDEEKCEIIIRSKNIKNIYKVLKKVKKKKNKQDSSLIEMWQKKKK